VAGTDSVNSDSVPDDELVARVERAERLAAARAAAYEALQRPAEVPELAEIAGSLGRALRATSDDEALWADLAASASRVQALPESKRDQLATVVNLDWSLLLDQLGYCPPPPARELSDDLRVAMSGLLSGGPNIEAREVAERIRSLANELIELSDTSPPSESPPSESHPSKSHPSKSHPSKSRLLRALRKGVRVAGQVLVPVAAGALGAAVIVVLPHIGIPAVAVAMAHHTAATTIVGAGVQNAISEGGDLVKGGSLAFLKKKQDKQAQEVATPASGAPQDDPADRAAVASIKTVRTKQISELRTTYELAQARLSEDEQLAGNGDNSPQPVGQYTLAQCDLLADSVVSVCTSELYDCWAAATGAEWATPQFHGLAQETADSLAAIRELLRVRRDQHVHRMLAALDELSHDLITLRIWLERRVR
jgi:hypothetical protein